MIKIALAAILILTYSGPTYSEFLSNFAVYENGWYKGYVTTDDDKQGDPNPLVFMCAPGVESRLFVLPQIEHNIADGPITAAVNFGEKEATGQPWTVNSNGLNIEYGGDADVFLKRTMVHKSVTLVFSSDSGRTATEYLLTDTDQAQAFLLFDSCEID